MDSTTSALDCYVISRSETVYADRAVYEIKAGTLKGHGKGDFTITTEDANFAYSFVPGSGFAVDFSNQIVAASKAVSKP